MALLVAPMLLLGGVQLGHVSDADAVVCGPGDDPSCNEGVPVAQAIGNCLIDISPTTYGPLTETEPQVFEGAVTYPPDGVGSFMIDYLATHPVTIESGNRPAGGAWLTFEPGNVTSWDLEITLSSTTTGSALAQQVVIYGSTGSGSTLGSRFSTYTMSWDAPGAGVVYDPAGQLDVADASSLINGGSFTQVLGDTATGAIRNNELEWYVVAPIGATSITILAEDGRRTEGFGFATIVKSASCVELEKTAVFNDENGNTFADVGETISYTFNIKNTGSTELTLASVSDPMAVVSGGPITIPAGVSDSTSITGTRTLTLDDLSAGGVSNQATVVATEPFGSVLSDTSDDPTNPTNAGSEDGEPDDVTFTSLAPKMIALPETPTVTATGTQAIDVGINDPQVTTGAVYALTGVGTAVGPASIDPVTGVITYTPDPTEAGTNVTLEYEVCPAETPPGSPNCDKATVTITVSPYEAADDGAALNAEGAQTVDPTGNDPHVATGAGYSLTGNGTATGAASIDPVTGVVTYTPDPTEAGTSVTLEYEVCPPGAEPGSAGCDTATITMAIAGLDAQDDTATLDATGVQTIDPTGNDAVTAGAGFSLTGNGTAIGAASIDPVTGVVTYTPDPTEAGTSVTLEYEVCPSGAEPGSAGCDTAIITMSIGGFVATDDNAPVNATGAQTIDPTGNDTVGAGATFGLTGNGSATGTASIDPSTGVITYEPGPGEAGSTVTLEYEVCPPGAEPGSAGCDTATVSIAVSGFEAADDNAPVNATGAQTIDPTTNDPHVATGAGYSLTGNGTAAGVASIDPTTGAITYTPDPSEAGTTVTLEYEVCPVGVEPGSSNCDTATVSIAVSPLEAGDDTVAVTATGAQTIDPTANDPHVSPGAGYSLTGNGTATGTASIDPATGVITYEPGPGEAGSTVTLEYEVCPEGFAPGSVGCGTATVTMTVGGFTAVDDTVAITATGVQVIDPTDNDTVAAGAGYSLTGNGTAAGTASIDPVTGAITYTPDPTEAGTTVTLEYEVCPDGAEPGSAGCDTATMTMEVGSFDAGDDTIAVEGTGAQTIDPTGNDNVAPGAVYGLTGNGTATGTASIDPATGVITYEPGPGDVGTSVTLEYEVCPAGAEPGSAGCDTATITMAVGSFDAGDDAIGVTGTGPHTIDPTGNDIVGEGAVYSLTGNGTAIGTASIDPVTGEITYEAHPSEAGSLVTLEYEVCPAGAEPGSAGCDTATITIGVDRFEAGDDDLEVSATGTQTIDPTGNDAVTPGSTYSLTGNGTAVGTASIDPVTGEITYTPDPSEAGTTVTLEYEVCPDGAAPGSVLCEQATVSIAVAAPQTEPDEVDIDGVGPATIDVGTNDEVPTGSTFNIVEHPEVGVATIDPTTGVITFTPPPEGLTAPVTIVYELCPPGAASGSERCSTGSVTIHGEPAGVDVIGRVYFDADRDGVLDIDEQDISDVRLVLIEAGPDRTFGTADDTWHSEAYTRSPFRFTTVPNGLYRIEVDTSTLPANVYVTDDADLGSDSAQTFGVFGSDVHYVDFGYNYAAITGTLTDTDGRVLANAQVVVTDAQGNEWVVTTDENGNYLVEGTAEQPVALGAATIVGTTAGGEPVAVTVDVADGSFVSADVSLDGGALIGGTAAGAAGDGTGSANGVAASTDAADGDDGPPHVLAYTGSTFLRLLLAAALVLLTTGAGALSGAGRAGANAFSRRVRDSLR